MISDGSPRTWKVDIEVSEDFISHADLVNPEEYVFRELANRMIHDLPLSEVKRIFKVSVFTGFDKVDANSPDWHRELISRLASRKLRKYGLTYDGNQE